MLSLIMASLALQASAPEYPTVICQPTGQIEHFQISELGFQCSGETVPDPEGLQSYLAAAVILMPETIQLPRDTQYTIHDDFQLIHNGHSWQFESKFSLVSVTPVFPVSAIRRGLNGRCAIRYFILPTGAAEVDEVVCEQYRGLNIRRSEIFEAPAIDFIEDAVWWGEPGAEPMCVITTLDFTVDDNTPPDPPIANAPTCPVAP